LEHLSLNNNQVISLFEFQLRYVFLYGTSSDRGKKYEIFLYRFQSKSRAIFLSVMILFVGLLNCLRISLQFGYGRYLKLILFPKHFVRFSRVDEIPVSVVEFPCCAGGLDRMGIECRVPTGQGKLGKVREFEWSGKCRGKSQGK